MIQFILRFQYSQSITERGRGKNHSQHTKGLSRKSGQDRNKGEKPMHCSYCDLTNHEIESCYTKKRHDRTDSERAELAKRMKMNDGSAKVAFAQHNEKL